MPDTPEGLAADLRILADKVAALKEAPRPDPEPTEPPAKPTGLRVTTIEGGRLQLNWDSAEGVTEWDVLDLANAAAPLKETVRVPRSIRSPMTKKSPARRYSVVARNAGGDSPESDPVDVPALEDERPDPDPGPDPGGKLPTDVLPALKTWTVTTTTGTPGSPTNLYPVKHGDGKGYIPGVFYVAPDGGVMYHATVDGVTTPNSRRCRVEARQMADDRWTKASWDGNEPHTLEAELWVSTAGLQKRKQVSALQIHDGGDDVLQVLADAEQGLIVKTDDGQTITVLDPEYQDHQRCTVRITTGGGKVRVDYSSGAVLAAEEFNKTGTSWYFKAGCYLQASMAEHGEPASAFGEVCIYRLEATGDPLGG